MSDETAATPVSVLLVDDDRICRLGVRRAFAKAGIRNPIYEAGNGVEALEMLRGTDGHAPVPRPVTILLDLNMPQMTGHEFLDEIRADPALRGTNVFVITTSVNRDDLGRCYARNVAGYVVKSGGAAPLADLARMLRDYWRVVRLT